MSLSQRSALSLRDDVAARRVSATEVAAAFCDRLDAVDHQVQAFLSFDRRKVLARAAEIDGKIAAGAPVGVLAGVPVAVKDLLCAVGEPATCGSRILQEFRAPYDAHVIERLHAADAVVIGRTNMDEFAMGSSCENSAFRKTRNPWNLDCVPGGSSGGSAAAVAADESPLALGTDTGGSIRQPASLCGITGLKPTYGRVSRYGLIAYASSLDQIGPMARSVEDCALLLSAIAGRDERDSTSVDKPVPDYVAALKLKPGKLRIGLVREYFGDGLDDEVRHSVEAAIGFYKQAGAEIVDVALPHAKYAIATYYLVATAEASSNLARYDGVHYGHRAEKYADMIDMYARSRGEGFGAEVKRRIMLGTFALSAGYRDQFYVNALKVRRLIKQDFDAAFAKADLLLGPTTPTAAFKIGEKSGDPLAMYLSDIYTVSTNLAGLPGLSVPCGFTAAGLPIGLQLQANAFDEERLLQAGHLFQTATDWHARRPAV